MLICEQTKRYLKFNNVGGRSSLTDWKSPFSGITMTLLNDDAHLWVSLTLFTPFLGTGSLWNYQHRPKLQFFNSTMGSGGICCCYNRLAIRLLKINFGVCRLCPSLTAAVYVKGFFLSSSLRKITFLQPNHSALLLVFKIWYRAVKHMG